MTQRPSDSRREARASVERRSKSRAVAYGFEQSGKLQQSLSYGLARSMVPVDLSIVRRMLQTIREPNPRLKSAPETEKRPCVM